MSKKLFTKLGLALVVFYYLVVLYFQWYGFNCHGEWCAMSTVGFMFFASVPSVALNLDLPMWLVHVFNSIILYCIILLFTTLIGVIKGKCAKKEF